MHSDIVLFDGTKFKLGFGNVYAVKLSAGSKEAGPFRILECDENSIQGVLERKAANIVLVSERSPKDHLHFRRTALNQVTCRLAKKNGIVVAFSFSNILNAKDRPLVMGRIMQNIRLCRKFKVDMLFASFARNKFEMRAADNLLAFAQILGMTAGEAKKALGMAEKVATRKTEAAKGVRIVGQ